METIFYYRETGEIISKSEANAIFKGFAVPRGTVGIVNQSQRVKIEGGKITNVDDIVKESSIIPPEHVIDVFTDIVNRHNLQVKKDTLDNIIKEYSIKTMGKYVSSTEEYDEKKIIESEDPLTKQRREKIDRIKKRNKVLKKVPLALVIGAMGVISVAGIKYVKNFDTIADDTNDLLNSHHCYINNDVEGQTKVAINDNTELYGRANPSYETITQNTYEELKNVLISEGYTDKEATMCLSSIVPTHTIKDIDVTSVSFKEKVDFVLNYTEELSLNR